MQPLEQPEYPKIRHLFDGSHLTLVSDALIAGNSPATVWVDAVANPHTAFVWDKTHCVYLAGEAGNGTLEQFVTQWFLPEARARRIEMFKVYYTSTAWEGQINRLFQGVSFTQRQRVLLALEQFNTADWRAWIPDGFSVHAIDRSLLDTSGLGNVHRVIEEIESCWNSLSDFFANGFGFCLLRGRDKVVSWCTAEYVSLGKCGIGIETVEPHFNRGFATLTASAFAAHCVAHQITPHWDSWETNLPSITVAQKVGFRQLHRYGIHLGRIE